MPKRPRVRLTSLPFTRRIRMKLFAPPADTRTPKPAMAVSHTMICPSAGGSMASTAAFVSFIFRSAI